MDMSSSAMSMTMSSTATAIGTAAAAAASSTMSNMTVDMSSDCKISMLWNWYTIDACFLSSTWQIKSRSMFAGSCIGVACLVLLLEFFRRLAKEYDRYLVRQNTTQGRAQSLSSTSDSDGLLQMNSASKGIPAGIQPAGGLAKSKPFRPSILQQSVRAGLHMMQFGIAYIIMLLAMYYNGFFIISIFLGAFIGSFIFNWETLGMTFEMQDDPTGRLSILEGLEGLFHIGARDEYEPEQPTETDGLRRTYLVGFSGIKIFKGYSLLRLLEH